MNKKIISILMSTAMGITVLTGCGSAPATTTDSNVAETATETIEADVSADSSSSQKTAGVIWYSFADTYTANAKQSLDNISAADGTIKVIDADTQNDLTIQDNNISNFFTQNVDYLLLQNINHKATSEIVNRCKEQGVTTLFVGTVSPSDDDFANYENLWYVSSASEQSGMNMGNAISDYFNNNADWDRNGNGKVDFILLQGLQTSSDTINRSSYSLEAIEKAGYELGTCIGGDDVTGVKGGDTINGVICDYQRAKAQENVEALLANFGKDIDCIIADNDDEALGAIAALRAHGYLTDESNYIPVVGVDATAPGCEALKDGTLLETSLNDPVALAKASYKLMWLLENGQEVTTETLGIDGAVVKGHRILLNYTSITKDNLQDAEYDLNDVDININ
ncbi:MAG: substrate-binding domain-containing protein [Lachnospiraceae bacterium]|nr:substrate-binding domain-containing protein [Lachnospiraceae bacterium]